MDEDLPSFDVGRWMFDVPLFSCPSTPCRAEASAKAEEAKKQMQGMELIRERSQHRIKNGCPGGASLPGQKPFCPGNRRRRNAARPRINNGRAENKTAATLTRSD
jgi:hypothetical protein